MALPSKPQSRAGMPPRKARVLLGASAKVGKTTLLGNWAPQTTLIVDTHHGTELLEGEHYVSHVRNWPEFVGVVTDICRGGHMFHTIGLDLVGDLWRFADLHFGRNKDGLRVPASGLDDYGRSSNRARAAFTAELGRLLAAPVGIWFLTHLREKTDKEGQLMVYAPDMNKDVHGYVMGAVDFVWLAEILPNGRRIVHTQPTEHFEAGSRRGLPSPLPMDAAEIARAMDRALNPQAYDEQGNRKVEYAEPEPVAPTEGPEPEPAPPTPKDVERTGASDVPSEVDPWFEEIRPLLKGIPSDGLRAAVKAAGGDVPERVGKWERVICALTAEQRVEFVKALEKLSDVPWTEDKSGGEILEGAGWKAVDYGPPLTKPTPEDAAVEVLNRVAEAAPDQLSIKETEARKP